jgi:Tfp pilus assembly protein PilN
MLRLNLSTRPFYNEGLVHLALGVAGAALLLGLVLNGRDVIRLSAARGALNARISTAEQAVATAEASRRSLEAKARQSDLDAIRRSAAEANSVIAARAFSWTALLNDVADQLPPGVRLVAVKPAHTDAETKVAMIVRGRSNADIEQFLTRLEATGRFSHGLVSDGELDDDGTLRVTLSIFYAAPPPGDAADPRAREGATP